ncbi:unnamed protein product, partial [Adineta ricciae]
IGIFFLTLSGTTDGNSESNSLVISVFPPKSTYSNPYYDPVTEELLSMDTNYTTEDKYWNTRKLIFKRSVTSKPTKKKTQPKSDLYGEEKLDQMKNQIVIDSQWEELISAGPVTINLLGQLVILSSERDFDLQESVPNFKFLHMKHPQSFSGTLIQIANDGWTAFHIAHKNMDSITSYMKQIPGYIQTALKLFIQGSPRIINRSLPKTLGNIERIGNKCIDLATETDKKFDDVIQLISEVIQVTTVSRGIHIQRVKNITRKIEITKTAINGTAGIATELQKKYEKDNAFLKQTQEDFRDALKRIPTGFQAILQDFTRMIVDVAQTTANQFLSFGGLTKILSFIGQKGTGVAGTTGNDGAVTNTIPDISPETAGILTMIKTTSEQINKIIQQLNGNINDPVHLEQELDAYKIAFESVMKAVQRGFDHNKIKSQALSLMETCINLIDNTIEYIKHMKSGMQISTEIKADWNNLQRLTKPILAANSFVNGPTTPNVGKGNNPTHDANDKYRNERFKAQQLKEVLKDTQAATDQSFNNWMEYQKKLNDLSIELASLDPAKINYQKIVELLNDALTLLGNLKEEWSKLVRFFNIITKHASIELNEPIKQFLNETRDALAYEKLSKNDRDYYRDNLKGYAKSIHRQAFILHVMAKTYVDMSNEHIITQLAGLAKLINAGTVEEKKRMSHMLKDKIIEIQKKVLVMVKQRREKYNKEVNEQIGKLDKTIENMGGNDPDDQENIKKGKDLLLNNDTIEKVSEEQEDELEEEDQDDEQELPSFNK